MKLQMAVDRANTTATGTDALYGIADSRFGLRVYPSGKKVFIFSYRVQGVAPFYDIGLWRSYR